jgi:hypothetical protein
MGKQQIVLMALLCACGNVKNSRDLPDAPPTIDADNADAVIDTPSTIDANPNCNNGVVDPGEDCDTTAPTDTTCVELGYSTGSVGCSASCAYDLTECTAAQPDLVTWYRFEDTNAVTSVVDSTTTGISLTRNGTTTLEVDGAVGSAIEFDGTTGYLNGGTPAALTNLPAVTAEAWVRLDAQTMFGAGVVSKCANNNNADFALQVWHSPAGSPFWMSSAVDATYGYRAMTASGGAAANGVWVHLAGVYNVATNTRQVYVNGVMQTNFSTFGADIAAPMNETGPFRIGNYVWNADQNSGFLDGRVDEVKIWRVARTQAQICSDAGGIASGGGCTIVLTP